MALFSFQLDKLRWIYGKRSVAVSEFPSDKAFSSSDERNIKVILGDSRGGTEIVGARKSRNAHGRRKVGSKNVKAGLSYFRHTDFSPQLFSLPGNNICFSEDGSKKITLPEQRP